MASGFWEGNCMCRHKLNSFSADSVVLFILQFHVTTRLKAHTTQRLLNSFAALDPRKTARVDQQHLKKDAGLPPVHGIFQKSSSDMAQLNHTLINGQDSYNRQVGF